MVDDRQLKPCVRGKIDFVRKYKMKSQTHRLWEYEMFRKKDVFCEQMLAALFILPIVITICGCPE